jgi:pyruvate formate lyase activating enzyme
MTNKRLVKGKIFDIQKFSTHDGPGIRTIVFLKGCVLRCRWCCNPESQSFETETLIRGGKEVTMGEIVTAGEVIDNVMRDLPYYRRSGGGLTLSGGEAMCQPDFAEALLIEAHNHGINTAIETTACVPYEIVQRLVPHIDYVLMDIKHMNSAKHEQFTTQKNELILDNAKKIAKTAKSLTIRVPVIPTFNDTEQEISDIANFASSLGTVKQIHLLPYHRLGYDKYVGLGRNYGMGDIPVPTPEKMHSLVNAAEKSGLTVVIGG